MKKRPEIVEALYREEDKGILQTKKTQNVDKDKHHNILSTKFFSTHDLLEDFTKKTKLCLFDDVINQSSDGIRIIGLDYQLKAINTTMQQFCGQPKENLIGFHCSKSFTQENLCKTEECSIKKMKKNPASFQRTTTRKNPDGTTAHFLENVSPLKNVDGELIGIIEYFRDITVLKNKEEELKTSKQHFENLFNSIIDPVAILDERGILLDMGEKIYDLTGYKKEELIGNSLLDTELLPDECRLQLVENLKKRVSGEEESSIYEIQLKHKDGRLIPIEINAKRIKYCGKSADMVLLRDVAERKQREELEARTQKIFEERSKILRVIYDTVIEIEGADEAKTFEILTTNLCRICKADYAALTYFEYEDERLVTNTVYISEHNEEYSVEHQVSSTILNHTSCILKANNTSRISSLKNPHSFPSELFSQWPKQKAVTDNNTYLLQSIHEDKIIAIACVQLPKESELKRKDLIETYLNVIGIIAQRTILNNTLKKSEVRHRSFIENTNDLVFSIDCTGRILFSNPSFKQILGYYEDDLLKSTLYDLSCKQSHGIIDGILSEDFSVDTQKDVQLQINSSDGKTHMIEGNIHYQKTEDGVPIIQCFFRDETARLQAEAEIKRQNKELKKLDQLKSNFLNITSHELRTPMSAIKGYLQMMQNKALGEINSDQQDALDIVLRNTNRLNALIQDILDVSRLESGTMKFVVNETDVNTLVTSVQQTMQASANTKQLTITTHLQANLPTLKIDNERITQVFINILNNAIKFSKEHTEITIAVKVQNDQILFEIQDQGPGIPKDQLTKIFDLFHQVNSNSDREYGGAGLGLAISRGIVLAHGGDIWVESVLGQGSCFKFVLPLQPVQNVEEQFRKLNIFKLEESDSLPCSAQLLNNGILINAFDYMDNLEA